jgi:hypothetical protein
MTAPLKLVGDTFAFLEDDVPWTGYVDRASLLVRDGRRELRVLEGTIDDDPFELVVKETAPGTGVLVGTWRYASGDGGGPVSLTLYGDARCALIGTYEEDGHKGTWVFQLEPE